MREQVQNMGAKQAALQAHNSTLAGEVERWKALWRQSASANQDLTQRLASHAIDQQVKVPPSNSTQSRIKQHSFWALLPAVAVPSCRPEPVRMFPKDARAHSPACLVSVRACWVLW